MIDHVMWLGQQQMPQTKKIQNYVFNLGDMLGKGNFSKVYRAINELTGDVVAVKVVELSSMRTPALVQLLYSQIEILKTLQHPNILNCLEVFTSANNCYIITEICNEGDLESRLRKTAFIDESHCRKYFCDVYQGLKYLAQQNIVHRDLKVANIFLKNGVAKLADFGFAKRTTEHFRDINIGSPIYMSPQGLLEGIYGPKTDVWAFGVFMFQMTQGDTPLGFCKTEAQLKYHITIPLTVDRFRRQVPPELRDLILQCLDVNEQRRIGMKEIQHHPYIRSLLSQNAKEQQMQEAQFNKGNNRNLMQAPKRGLSPANSNVSHPISHHRGGSVDPSLNRNRQNQPQPRQPSPPRHNHTHSGNTGVNTTSINNISINQGQSSHNVSLQSINQIQSPHNMSQQSINPRSNQHIPTSSNQQILVSKLKFQECVYLLHYCRLIYKCLKLMSHGIFPTLKQCLTNFLLNSLDEIHGKVPTYVQYEGSKAAQRENKMKDVVKEYYQKYHKELKKFGSLEPSLSQLNQLLIQALTQMDARTTRMEPSQLTLANYLITILESNKALQSCISTHNYKVLAESVAIQSFLNSNTKETMTFRGEEIRAHMRQLVK